MPIPNGPLGALMGWPTLPLTEPVWIIAAVLLLVLALPFLGRAIRTPDIILLILAGMLFGPNGTNLLERGQAIEVWGTVGLLYIMFLAGLEVNVADFKRNRNRSAILGGLSFVVPQFVGAAGAVWLLGFGWTKAILLASMLASFTLLTYPQVSRLGLARHESVSVSVGGVVITDTLALLVLAVIVELHGQEHFSWFFILRLAVAFCIFLAIMVLGVPRVGRWFFKNAARDGGAQFLFVLVVAFLAGALSELAGVESIIGAFLAGVTLNRLVPSQSPLMNRIQFIGHHLFIPFFLISVGMIVDPRVFIADRHTWIVGAYMVIAVFATKFVASKLAQWWLGYTSDEGWVIFGLTLTQAAATLAAVMVGFDLGIFDDAVLNGTLMMILATCMVSPLITEYFGRRVALQTPAVEHPSQDAGRILVPVDNPDTADRIIELALLLRPPDSTEPLLPLRVVRTGEDATADITRNEKMMMGVMTQAAAADVPVQPSVRVAAGIAEGIRRATVELRASTVLLGWSRGGHLGTTLFGGILSDVLEGCRPRIAVCQLPAPPNTINHVMLAIPPNGDREPCFRETLLIVWRLAHQIGADITVLTPERCRPRIEEITTSLRPALSPTWDTRSRWAEICRHFVEPADTACLRVLLCARPGGLSWHPSMERLPRVLGVAGDAAGALLLHPPLPADDDDNEPLLPARRLNELVSIGGVCKTAATLPFEAALDRLLGQGMKEPARMECRRVLLQASEQFPIELAPGVALVHAHTHAIDSPDVYLLSYDTPIRLADIQADLVFILLGPSSGAPERHLQILSALARLIREPDRLAALRDADGDAELGRQLSELISRISS